VGEYLFKMPQRTTQEVALQTSLDIARIIEFSSPPQYPLEQQSFLYLSNPNDEVPNTDPLTDSNGETIIKSRGSDYVDTKPRGEIIVKPIELGYYSYYFHASDPFEIQAGLLQFGIRALSKGRTVCGIQRVENNDESRGSISIYEKPIPSLPEDKKEEIEALYDERVREPLPFDTQLTDFQPLQLLYPRRAEAVQEGFVTMGRLDLAHIPMKSINRINQNLKEYLSLGGRDITSQVHLPRLGGLYSYYRLLQAGLETQIVEEIGHPLHPTPNAFAIMARRPQEARR
jgi:hypothetical protein